MTFEEQMRGRLAQISATPSVPLYAALNNTFRFYQNIAIWQYTEEAERQLTALQQAKIRIGTQDLKIASIALTVQATLLTRNAKDFAKVPRLRIEDWTS